MVRKFDFLVIGSGIAGMSFALKVAHKGKVGGTIDPVGSESNLLGWKKPIPILLREVSHLLPT